MPRHLPEPLDQVQEAFPEMSPHEALKYTETFVQVAQETGSDVQTVIDEAAEAGIP